MIKKTVYILLAGTLLGSCAADTSFEITNDAVGPLTRNSTASDLKTLFEKDSLVTPTGTSKIYKVYEKGGAALLSLEAETTENSSTFENIRILDNRYATPEGITTTSTFKDITDAYTVKRIDNLLGQIVVFVEDSDVYFSIDKKHLPGELMFDTSIKIETTQIPDDTPIKYFMIGW